MQMFSVVENPPKSGYLLGFMSVMSCWTGEAGVSGQEMNVMCVVHVFGGDQTRCTDSCQKLHMKSFMCTLHPDLISNTQFSLSSKHFFL